MGSRRTNLLVIALATCAAGVVLRAAELKPETLAGYERYVAATEARIASERQSPDAFLWIDRQPPAQRSKLLERLGRGEVVVESLETKAGGKEIEIKDGLVHHWVGTVLMPGVSVDRVITLVQDYGRYPQLFSPMIQRAKIVNHEQDRYTVSMRTYVKKVISVVMDGDYVVDYVTLSPTRVATTNVATNLQQVSDPGTRSEARVPTERASGYLWRFRMYCAFEERPEGSLEQCESVSLTREIPMMASWFISPFVSGIPRDTIAFTLGKVRGALVSMSPKP